MLIILLLNMKHNYFNIFYLTMLFMFTLNNYAFSKQENYSVFAKLPLLGEIEVQKIITELDIKENLFEYLYNVNPTKVVDFFDDKVSNGYIKGELKNNSIETVEYFFETKKEDFKRIIKFTYLDGVIENVFIEPIYNTSKITSVSEEMIKSAIDPVTMFYLITSFDFIKGCDKVINVYDGKRRYNLILSEPIESEKTYSCTLTHQKVAGYKNKKIIEDEKYISDLNFFLNDNQTYEFNDVSLRNENLDLIIRKIR